MHMSELTELLQQIDRAISAAKPKLHARLAAPATPDDLGKLRAAIGELPVDLSEWFGWHCGSPGGFLPDTSVALVDVEDAIKEISFIKANPPSKPLSGVHCPILSDGGGGLRIYVCPQGQQAELWRYDRGEILSTEPFLKWVAHVRDLWVDERSILRVDFLRAGRSLMGWEQIEIPLKSRKKVLALFKGLAAGASFQLRSVSACVRFGLAQEASWSKREGLSAEILLTHEGAGELAQALGKEESAAVPGLPDNRISFSAM